MEEQLLLTVMVHDMRVSINKVRDTVEEDGSLLELHKERIQSEMLSMTKEWKRRTRLLFKLTKQLTTKNFNNA
jgi:hypothetical protein